MSHYIIVTPTASDDEYRLVGPFATDEDAINWGAENLPQGDWLYPPVDTPQSYLYKEAHA